MKLPFNNTLQSILSVSITLLISSYSFGQNDRLAQYYFDQAEYSKAATMYKQLYDKNPNQEKYFQRYIKSLAYEPNLDKAKEELDKHLTTTSTPAITYLMKAEVAEIEGDIERSEKYIDQAIQNAPADPNQVLIIANDLVKRSRYKKAIEIIKYAEKKHNLEGAFESELATFYRYAGDLENMIAKQLDLIVKYPTRINEIKQVWSDYLYDDHYTNALKQTYAKIQSNPQIDELSDLLAWTYIQLDNYDAALRQLIALDRRQLGDGLKVYNLGNQAYNAKKYDEAITAYNYILENKEKSNAFYVPAKYAILKSYKALHHTDYHIDMEQMKKVSEEYRQFFEEFPLDNNNILMLRDWAEILAFDLDQLDQATELIESSFNKKGLNEHAVGNLKLLLGDIYLLNDDRWEATLLYSQVDKKFREGLLGEQARYKNAKLSYYLGDFDWAQTQFEVLKTATTRLIANDAIDLSVFITDNLGLDTTAEAITDFANAEFLRFRRDYGESEDLLKKMLSLYPDHSLTDDIYYELANLYRDQEKFDLALEYYQLIVDNHADEIRCDNALFAMAKIYDYALSDHTKAMNLYEKLFIDFSASTFSVDARKRFRQLRGDELE